ncbi:uncharacterized protein KQ657_001592 [Scheffersomyces spartinae]|uniref:Nucleolar pre-ribosomal-associated protein 1 n=1 Tax=Scheffersomyces spartinae TaxID=45513 RepID=A0A9P7V7A5_9ASCO|nr:uncharacterized protein KQ657_001592 [Scheffersomyces spartinae]KAG7192497.1 hypothetical protein KQ657_001592 [Scheffersomyces spartinae]
MASKKNDFRSPNVDTEAIDKLNQINESSDLHDTVEFIKSANLAKLLNTWSYCNSVNDHAGFIKITKSLAKFTHKLLDDYKTQEDHLALLMEAKPLVVEWYKSILHNHMKIIYRCLTNNRNQTTLPILHMLENIVEFHPSTLVTEFINAFDFNIPVLPKLLVPGRDQYIRSQFIRFWIKLNTLAPYHIRKDILINNYKIANNLIKHIAEDPVDLLTQWFEFLTKMVLMEPSFKKSTKCKIINDNTMFKIQSLIDLHVEESQFRSIFDNFVTTLTTDFKFGVCFISNPVRKEDAATNGGVPITAYGKSFRIHNKLLFSFLKSLKPSESNLQLNVAIETLKYNQELIIPYMYWIIQSGGGFHEPNLSSWWIGHTLFYSQILTLPIPKIFHEDQLVITSNRLVVDMISLPPISRAALTHCLDDKQPPLVRQLAVQLIILTLKRLSKFLPYTENKQELTNLVFQRLPDLANIILIWQNQVEDNINDVLKLSCSTAANLYELAIPTNNNALIKLCNSEIQKVVGLSQLSGWDLVNLDNCLSIQFHQADQSQLRWYSSTANSHSLFTNLLKLAATATGTTSNEKFINLISTLVEYKADILFNQQTLCSVVTALFRSFEEEPIPNEIAKLLDELVGRSIKTPYKYTDLSHAKYNDVSMFVVVLMEQVKFVQSDISLWLGKFLRSLIIIGESEEGITKLIDDYLSPLDFLQIDAIKSYTSFTPKPCSETPDFVEYVLNDTKLTQVSKKIITSDYELCALLLRLKLLLNDHHEAPKDELIIELGIKIGQYLSASVSGNKKLKQFILSTNFWKLFFPESQEEASNAKLLMSHLMNEVYIQLGEGDLRVNSELCSFMFSKWLHLASAAEADTNDYTKLLGQFDWMFTLEQVLELLAKINNQYLRACLLRHALKHKLMIPSSLFINVLENCGDGNLEAFEQALESRIILLKDNQELKSLIESVINSKQSFLKSICIGFPEAIELLVEVPTSPATQFLIAEAIATKKVVTPRTSCYMEDIASKAIQLYEQDSINLKQLLEVVSYNETTRAVLSVDTVFNTYIDKIGYKYCFTPEFAQFISLKNCNDNDSQVRTWKHKCMLYITKKFAESETLLESFDRFLLAIRCQLNDIWDIVPTNILNTQLEVILRHSKWVQNEHYLRYVFDIISSTTSKKQIDFVKLLQIFVNNEANGLNDLPLESNFECRFVSADIIGKLFRYDDSKNATELLQENLLLKYLGSVRYEDLVLKEILKKIESKLSRSWMIMVSNWEFSELLSSSDLELVTMERLLQKISTSGATAGAGGSYVVNLNKNFVINTINYGKFDKNLAVPEINEIQVSHSYDTTVYDREFLLMLILNNEELVRIEDDNALKFDVGKLIDSGILQFIVTCLSDPSVKTIAISILSGVLRSLTEAEDKHKNNIIQVYVANILNTVKKNQFELLAPVAVFAYASLIPILANPAHFLYEKSFRYVLSNPTLKASNGIALFHSISTASTNDSELSENDESYYRQLTWLLQILNTGTSTTTDVSLVQKTGVLEWALNVLTNNEYIQSNIIAEALKLLATLQSIDYAGDLLVTRFAITTSLNQLVSNTNLRIQLTTNERELASLHQIKLNVDQLIARFALITKNSHRLSHWASKDLPHALKRIHTEAN